MKSKVYILSQIADLLVERHGYTREKANRYAELHANDKVYELLVLKKSLSENEESGNLTKALKIFKRYAKKMAKNLKRFSH